ncbi:MAG TPA: GAF domain-containing sensor histidine kinase [Acidobacteriota bacterium]|nr:GAF domain-containing sensor histidine kinase [Acidobacteriota bacterium]
MTETKPKIIRYLDAGPGSETGEKFSRDERGILKKINDKIAGSVTLDNLMNFLFEETSAIFPCDRIGLAFVEEDGKRIVCNWVAARYSPLLLDEGYSEELARTSLKQVVEKGTPRIISDLRTYLTEHPNSLTTSLLVREGVNSSMTCPLSVEGRRVGVIFRSSRQPDAYNDHHVRLHMEIAERLGQVIEKAYSIEQLAAAKSAYLEMLGFVSHELKNPLSSIIMDGHALAKGYLGDLSEAQTKKVEAIMRKAEFLHGLVKEYLDLARIEVGELRIGARNGIDFVDDIIAPAMEMMKHVISERGMQLDLDVPDVGVEVECDPSLLKIVITNLLSNAVKYGKEGGDIVLTAHKTENNLVVSVWNEGPGFSEKDQTRLFRKFTRLHVPELFKQKGTGVGLYTTWRIINLHGGRIWARSEQGLWAEFSFRIPQPLSRPPA